MLEKNYLKSNCYNYIQEIQTTPLFFIQESTYPAAYTNAALLNVSIAELRHHYPALTKILEKIDPDMAEEEGIPIPLICAHLILRELKASGISMQSLSREIKITLPTLNNILRGKTNSISFEVFWKITDTYLVKTKSAKD
jgi:hypothetical protein